MDDDSEIFLRGPAGRLEALIRRIPGARRAALVCHPHPRYGGNMYNKVAYRVGRALSAAGLTVLRFNFRGVGASEGSWDEGRGEREDAAALIDHLAAEHDEILVAGFSFGAWVGLDVGLRHARVGRVVGVGLPVNIFDFGFLRAAAKPTLLVQGDCDGYGDVEPVRALAAAAPHVQLQVLAGADHFFEAHFDALMGAVTVFAAESGAPQP